ncbi:MULTISPECIES: ABC transporter permease [unclassified Diaminobutyricimonas]|uniref:ABC transporter permease n=1 Tax=unclassified Diaminobutyricimonas TaxID=2643261 RepID=UPI0012F498F0|nr:MULTISPECIES: ABC transporter permease [unclassified Diaminobutyricimonas]
MSGLVSSILEAWSELKINRTRVLLSLIGVAVAVAALTSVTGVGGMARQAMVEQYERGSGRPAMLMVSAWSDQGNPIDSTQVEEAFLAAVDRYNVEYHSRMFWGSTNVQFSDGTRMVQSIAVDADYGVMHRMEVADGRWLADTDVGKLAPSIVVNERFHESLGSPDLGTHPTVMLRGQDELVTAVVVGITPSQQWETEPMMHLLVDDYERFANPVDLAMGPPQYEMWVPPELGDQLQQLVERDIAAALGEDAQASVSRNDYLVWGGGSDPLLPFTLTIGGVAVLVLLLGALGLVNITMVTVKYRIREIGIRRSFGASAGRVFFSVMMESVVATAVAGFIGVLIAVAVVSNPSIQQLVANGIEDLPSFPMDAAITGMLVSVVVGAIAGLLPAIVAVRVKVIDAIRY